MVGTPAVGDLDAAYAACLRQARDHYENFPVASLLVPRAIRRDIAAVYAFARTADDFADEGALPPALRHRLLESWLQRLRHAAVSDSPGPEPREGEPPDTVALFRALGASIRARQLPISLFEDLLSAFGQDVDVAAYRSWSDLLDYCRRSANPVGRLVLRIAGYADARLERWSDAICTALQLTNFWQDVEIDRARGRVYLPEEELRSHASTNLALVAAAQRTRRLFDEGRPLCDAMSGRLGLELRATWLGGVRVLDKVQRARAADSSMRPTLRATDLGGVLVRTFLWQRTP